MLLLFALFHSTRITIHQINTTVLRSLRSTWHRIHRAQCIWYTKLALILGLTWIMTIMAIFIPISHIFFYTHAFSTLQGVMIFYAFTCRANVCHLLRRRLNYHTKDRKHFWQRRRATQSLSRNHSLNTGNEANSLNEVGSALFQIEQPTHWTHWALS